MPEYLAPGVFIEEVPARLKAIEGVSTSTAGFVGLAERGPVAGFDPPFDGEADGFPLPIEQTPVLVTSYSEFLRKFGNPIPLSDTRCMGTNDGNGHLARAVQAFFENGGKRCYIARITHDPNPPDADMATCSTIALGQGQRLLLIRQIDAGIAAPQISLSSVRGLAKDTIVRIVSRQNPNIARHVAKVTEVKIADSAVVLETGPDSRINPSDVYVMVPRLFTMSASAAAGDSNIKLASVVDLNAGMVIEVRTSTKLTEVKFTAKILSVDTASKTVAVDVAGNPMPALDKDKVVAMIQGEVIHADGPVLHARSPGAWSKQLRAQVLCADRPPVSVAAAAALGSLQIRLTSTASFYRGAIIEINNGTMREIHEVKQVLQGGIVALESPIATALVGSEFVRVLEINIVVVDNSAPDPIIETFSGLSWNPSRDPDIRARHYATVINTKSRLVFAQAPGVDGHPGTETADLAGQPMTPDGFSLGVTVDGDDEKKISEEDYIGKDEGPGRRTGIQSLADADDVRIIAAPGCTGATVHNALITQCENLRYRFAVLDGEEEPADGSINAILAHRNLYDTSFAAYYAPWIEVKEGGRPVYLPPSGSLCGIYARTDVERGVWKAPANEVVRGATGLKTYITTGEQEILNPRGVNATRRFEGRGIRVWGARTLSSDPEFKYINVRRFLIFLEASIDRGTQYVVFEPNAPETWNRVRDSINAFLYTQWRDGALFGRKPDDAYFVRCDESTMSVDDIQNGRLICQIGVSIVRPAEFVIFRIQQITGFGNQA